MRPEPQVREIVFLAHRIPYPPDRGDKIRSFNIVKHLAATARVHVAAFADDEADAAHEAGLRTALGHGLASSRIIVRRRSKAMSLLTGLASGRSASTAAFASSAMRRHVATLMAQPNMAGVFAFSGQMGQYVPERKAKSRFIMDFVDVDSAKFESYAAEAGRPMKPFYALEAARLAREEERIARRADVSLFVTPAEAELFRARSHLDETKVRALGNGVDLDYFDASADFQCFVRKDVKPLLVFSGQMDYAPNVQAVTHFAREILPQVRASMPDVLFAIVGRNPASAVRALAGRDGVEVIGAVPDVRPWLAAADVVVAPLRIARGVQNKVLEAMAMARPVVASPAAFEGIDAVAGLDLVVADGDAQSASAVLSLLRDEGLAGKIGRSARARMCDRYAWDRQLADLPRLMFG